MSRASTSRLLVTALSLGIAMFGGACNCNQAKTGLKPDPNGGDPLAGKLTINVVGSKNIVLAPNRDLLLKFIVTIGGENGTPVGGARVEFSKTGPADTLLGSDSLMTENDGTVSVKFRAGATNGQGEITASTEGAEPAKLRYDINGKYAGNIVVRSGYSGTVKIARLEVRLHDGRAACNPNWKQTVPNGLPATIQTVTVPNTTQDARFNNLTEKQKYIATVVAVNAMNRPVAYGCGGPEEVVAQHDKIIAVQLDTLEPTVLGQYDFGESLEPMKFMDPTSTLYKVMMTTLNLLNNPVDGLLRGIVTDSNPTNGGCALVGINASMCSAAVGFLTVFVNQLLNLDGSGTATAVFNGMHDAAQLVQNPRFGGYVNIKTYDLNTKDWTGEYVLDTFNLVWRAQPACVKSGANQNPQTCCGHYIFDGGDIGMTVFKAPVKGKLTRRNQNELIYDITMDETQLAIAYGAMVKALLENVILPRALPATFPGNNDGIVTLGELVSGLIYSAQCNTLSSAEAAACNAIQGAVSGITTALTSALVFNGTEDWNVKQFINAGTLSDTDEDLQTDELVASISTKATANGATAQNPLGSDIFGKFATAACSGDVPSGKTDKNGVPLQDGCAAGLSCRFSPNQVDTCFAKNFCGVSEGTKNGGDFCTGDTECFSGTCIKAPPAGYTYNSQTVNKCYKACETDANCGGTGHCDPSGLIYVRTPGQFWSPNDNPTFAGTCVP